MQRSLRARTLLPPLSIQQLSDCSSDMMSFAQTNFGCEGGYLSTSIFYMMIYGLTL